MKYTIKEKQEHLKSLRCADYFDADRELFQKRFSRSPLLRELGRANSVNKEKLDGNMLNILLDVFSAEEILKNRGVEVPVIEDLNSPSVNFETIEQVKEVLKENGVEIQIMLPAFLETLIGRNIAEVIAEITEQQPDEEGDDEKTDEGDGETKTETEEGKDEINPENSEQTEITVVKDLNNPSSPSENSEETKTSEEEKAEETPEVSEKKSGKKPKSSQT